MTRLPDPTTQADFYADVPLKRALAWVIDSGLTFALTLLIGLLTVGIGLILFVPLWAVVTFFYRWGTIAARSATPGMRFVGIEFRTDQGQAFDGLTALLHTVGTIFAFSSLLQIVSAGMMLTTARGQGLVDVVLGTVALNRKGRS